MRSSTTKTMPNIFHRNLSTSLDISRTVQPSSEFYAIFSEREIFGIIQALEVGKEIPLKYSYKGRGAKIWDNFYLKYIIPTWYRRTNLEIEMLNQNFAYLNGDSQKCQKVNIIDVGAGNSQPVKQLIARLDKLGKINKYIALDISEELLDLSQNNLKIWFPDIEYRNQVIDIENNSIPTNLAQKPDNIANIILHLGVTIANHQNRHEVFKNLRDSMEKNDVLVFTCEIGANSQWDGIPRGGCKYHVDGIYQWVQDKLRINVKDCELVRKYDLATDSIVANIRFLHDYKIHFSCGEIDKNIQILAGEEITIWRHHKFQISELQQELAQVGLELIHYTGDKYLSHIMVICQVVSQGED
jgi:uncharacterized SAM-dependent methyltransferase